MWIGHAQPRDARCSASSLADWPRRAPTHSCIARPIRWRPRRRRSCSRTTRWRSTSTRRRSRCMPGWSLALLHSEVDERGSWLGRGDALYAGGRVIGPLAIGATLQSIRPDDLRRVARRRPATTTARWRRSPRAGAPPTSLSFGITTRAFCVRQPTLRRPDGARRGRDAAAELVARGVVRRRATCSSRASGFGTAGLDLGTSLMLSRRAAAVRRGADARPRPGHAIRATPSDSARAAALCCDMPYVGTASGVVEVDHFGDSGCESCACSPSSRSTSAASARSAAASRGDGFDDDPGWYAMLRVEGEPRAGHPDRAERARDRAVGASSPRGMTAVALVLERARTDDRIARRAARSRAAPASASPTRRSCGCRSRRCAQRGKKVVCHLDSASGSEYYACAGGGPGADRPGRRHPADGQRQRRVLLFGETLRKIGVRADFVRIGPYKSAPEQYTQEQLSEAAREQTRALLDDAHRRVLSDLARDLQVTPQRESREIMDDGAAPRARARCARSWSRPRPTSTSSTKSCSDAFGGRAAHAAACPKIEPRALGQAPRDRRRDGRRRDRRRRERRHSAPRHPHDRRRDRRADARGDGRRSEHPRDRAARRLAGRRRARVREDLARGAPRAQAQAGDRVDGRRRRERRLLRGVPRRARSGPTRARSPARSASSTARSTWRSSPEKLGVGIEHFRRGKRAGAREPVPAVHRRRARGARRCAARLLPAVPRARRRRSRHVGRGGRRARARPRVLGRRSAARGARRSARRSGLGAHPRARARGARPRRRGRSAAATGRLACSTTCSAARASARRTRRPDARATRPARRCRAALPREARPLVRMLVLLEQLGRGSRWR